MFFLFRFVFLVCFFFFSSRRRHTRLVSDWSSDVCSSDLASGHKGMWALLLLGAFLTSFYTSRMLFLAFYSGPRMTREAAHHVHESPGVMTFPLWILALLTVITGVAFGIPSEHGTRFERFLAPVFPIHESGHSGVVALMLLVSAVFVFVAGVMVAWSMYMASAVRPDTIGRPRTAVHALLLNAYYVDALYDPAVVTFLLSLPLYFGFDAELIGYQFEEHARWMPTLGVSYHVGVDGISLLLVLLTTFLMPLALASAWDSIEDRVKEFVATMLILETGMLGVFVSLDLFLFYVFWEAMLIPMYFVIGVWGGPNRIYAAVKFVLYTMVGSMLMLVAILALYYQYGAATGRYTFDLPLLTQYVMAPGRAQSLMFLGFALAFAIKVPLFPFHTWLPDAHVEAPTAGSVILAGVLLKMGTYGFLRFCLPLFPDAALAYGPLVFPLAVIGVIYGAWVSTVQPDMKKLVAYSSVSHLGFVMLGIFTLNQQGLVGGLIQMVNHGLSTGALFLMVGMIYERRHSRLIAV